MQIYFHMSDLGEGFSRCYRKRSQHTEPLSVWCSSNRKSDRANAFRDASRLPMQKLKTRFLVNTKSGHEWELLLNIKTRPVEAYWLSVSEMFWAYSISFNGNCLFYSLNYQLSIINSISNKSYSIVRAWSLIIPWNNLNGSCCFTLNAINSSFPGNYRDWDL